MPPRQFTQGADTTPTPQNWLRGAPRGAPCPDRRTSSILFQGTSIPFNKCDFAGSGRWGSHRLSSGRNGRHQIGREPVSGLIQNKNEEARSNPQDRASPSTTPYRRHTGNRGIDSAGLGERGAWRAQGSVSRCSISVIPGGSTLRHVGSCRQQQTDNDSCSLRRKRPILGSTSSTNQIHHAARINDDDHHRHAAPPSVHQPEKQRPARSAHRGLATEAILPPAAAAASRRPGGRPLLPMAAAATPTTTARKTAAATATAATATPRRHPRLGLQPRHPPRHRRAGGGGALPRLPPPLRAHDVVRGCVNIDRRVFESIYIHLYI